MEAAHEEVNAVLDRDLSLARDLKVSLVIIPRPTGPDKVTEGVEVLLYLDGLAEVRRMDHGGAADE
uniref:hypothetical protein n=1 Tax=Amycolatopsis sacchari TaxID=115433 RepID=UPI003EBF3C5F